MTDRNRDCAEHDHVHDYEDWLDQIDGKPSSLPASRVGLGYFAKRERDGSHVGIAIWLNELNGLVAMVGRSGPRPLESKAAEEDFSFNVMAWAVAVTEEAYRAWFHDGAWPEGTKLDRSKPRREKPAVAPVEISAQDQPAGNLFVRSFQTCDPPKPTMAFMAMAIRREADGSDGFAVRFYGQDRPEAVGRAQAWIDAEKAKLDARIARNAAAGQRSAERAASRRSTTTDQPSTEGASA